MPAQVDIKAVRVALAAALNTIPGLTAYPRWPGTLNPPAAVITRRETVYSPAMDIGADVGLTVRLFLSISNPTGSMDTIDDYLAPSGPRSLRAVIEATGRLAGTVDWVKVVSSDAEAVVNVKGIDYLSSDLIVEVG